MGLSITTGWADEKGIHFRQWFRTRFASWKGIARIEYWPNTNGRIDLHLYTQPTPVVFLGGNPGLQQNGLRYSDTVDFISAKLSETWPGHSPFVVSIEDSRIKERTPGHKAITDALFMLALVVYVVVYGVLRFKVRFGFVIILIGALYGCRLAILLFRRLSGPKAKPVTLTKKSSGGD